MTAVPSPLEEEDVTAPVAYERRDEPGNYNERQQDAFWNLGMDEEWKQGEDDRLDLERTINR